MACRAAEAVALRELTQTVRGVLLQTSTEVNKNDLKEDIIKVKVDALLAGAIKVGEEPKPDGSCEVTMEIQKQQ